MSATDRVLQFASLSFDAAAEEIYPTWFSGATLILRPGYAPIGVSELRDFIEQKKLTLFQLPTAYWHQWVAQLSQNPLPLPNSLRLIYVGGEQVQPEFYRQWLQAVGTKVRWSNTYGPTEATITAIIYKNDGSPETVEAHADLAPIGLPMANAQAYVLDRELQPVPLGAVGELYLGGEGLARGYLKRPDLTAGSFIPNPYGQSGARMYRTGDLVRYLADGNLVYIGRRDQQVKVRGYRIELGEIEATLLHYPQIRECVVIAREDVPGDKYLAAYIVGNQSQDAVSEIRQFLSAHLPKYMLPASYIFLDRFPVTTSGKINRQALPIPTHERDADMETYVAPRTPVEKVLVGAWSEVLDGTQVGIYDDFFEIGGHSLRAIQLVARIQDVLSVDLPLRHVFEYSTVASMAEAMLQDESQRETINTAAELFLRVSNLSDEEVEALLNQ